MASEGDHMDHVAENLQNAAKETLEKSEASGTDGAPDGDPPAASPFIQNVAHIVLDKSNQAADSSKAYIENVIHKVQHYAENAASGASGSTSNVQETLSKAVHVGAYPGSTTGTPGDGDAASGSDGGLMTSVATWCSSLCGSKNAAGEPRSIDFRAAAENVAQVLHSSTTTSTVDPPSPYAVTPAETPPEAPAEPAKAQSPV